MLKSYVPHFYPKMHFDAYWRPLFRNPSSLIQRQYFNDDIMVERQEFDNSLTAVRYFYKQSVHAEQRRTDDKVAGRPAMYPVSPLPLYAVHCDKMQRLIVIIIARFALR